MADLRPSGGLVLILRGFIIGSLQLTIFAALLLIPAGTWYWPRAILFLVGYGLLLSTSIVVLARLAPASIEARLPTPAAKTQPKADRVVTLLLISAFCAWLIFIPINVFHLRLFPAPPLWLSIAGAGLFVLGFGIVMTALFQNAFAAPIVSDQSERGQVLIDSGLYGLIRHPLYLGLLPFYIGLALWLESYANVLAVPLVFAFVVARIFVEERTLREILPGYVEYMARVRYRIIPFIW